MGVREIETYEGGVRERHVMGVRETEAYNGGEGEKDS